MKRDIIVIEMAEDLLSRLEGLRIAPTEYQVKVLEKQINLLEETFSEEIPEEKIQQWQKRITRLYANAWEKMDA